MAIDNSQSSQKDFEVLVRDILKKNDFDCHEAPRQSFDFVAKLGGETWAVEVKYYRTALAQMPLIETAAAQLVQRVIAADIKKAMLVLSCFIPPKVRERLESLYSVVFVDRMDLEVWAAQSLELSGHLAMLTDGSPTSELAMLGRKVEDAIAEVKEPPNSPVLLGTIGADLSKELKALEPGRDGCVAYEELCERILKYLFSNDLSGWHKQNKTCDGVNRFDCVCRIKPRSEFWKFLMDHLSSRYIIFEFKNYKDKIKQGEVLTTEKYLLEKGLRLVAVIITRAGADKGARKMIAGAMREQGKLMLVIDDNQVCEMLRMRERGEDPADLLFNEADKFLLSLSR